MTIMYIRRPIKMTWDWIWVSKRRRLFFYSCVIVISGIWILSIRNDGFRIRVHLYHQIKNVFQNCIGVQSTKLPGELLQEECQIPITPTLPAFFRNSRKWTRRQNISSKFAGSKHSELRQNDEILHLSLDMEPADCCIRQIPKIRSDNAYSPLENCTPLQGRTVELNLAEIFAIECNNSGNLSVELKAAMPEKIDVRAKMDYWEKKAGLNQNSNLSTTEDTPINILMIGFDTTSRAHALRSLPKTVGFLTKNLDFVDFDQFHSVGPSTLPNINAALMGLRNEEVHATCALNESWPYDDCPFIWKDFSAKKFVTNFLEDGTTHGTFQWGTQSGFDKEPTDYYIRRFFLALEHLDEQQAKEKWKKLKRALRKDFSENAHFVLNYTARFIHKFKNTPFFSFTFFAHPFHDSLYALREMDDSLLEFFQNLRGPNFQGFLEKTLIIFFSDHGDRWSFFEGNSPESFIERGAPPLFIRLPEILEEKYPRLGLREALKYNSKKLATPFDIHQTLRHILALSFPEAFTDFRAQLNDRSSLLVKVPPGRNCLTLNISLDICLCGLSYQNEGESNSTQTNINFFMKKFSKISESLLAFATEELNQIVENSEYRRDCKKWTTTPWRSVTSVRVIGVSQGFLEILLGFRTKEGAATFSARIRVHGTPSSIVKMRDDIPREKMELLGIFRTSRYGNQSSCIETRTAVDKKMKEFCICKKKT